jgi:hypothetical protein
MMSSIFGYVCLLCYFLTLYLITIDTRSINEKDTVEFIVDNRQAEIILANYRHRFEHSMNLKQLRWTMENRYNKAYCDFCDIVIPVVKTS